MKARVALSLGITFALLFAVRAQEPQAFGAGGTEGLILCVADYGGQVNVLLNVFSQVLEI